MPCSCSSSSCKRSSSITRSRSSTSCLSTSGDTPTCGTQHHGHKLHVFVTNVVRPMQQDCMVAWVLMQQSVFRVYKHDFDQTKALQARCLQILACHILSTCSSVSWTVYQSLLQHQKHEGYLATIGVQDSVGYTKQQARVSGIHQELAQALQQRQQTSSVPPTCRALPTGHCQRPCCSHLNACSVVLMHRQILKVSVLHGHIQNVNLVQLHVCLVDAQQLTQQALCYTQMSL